MNNSIHNMASHFFKGEIKLNFFEWLYLRRCCIAWNFANNAELNITKSELFNVGF